MLPHFEPASIGGDWQPEGVFLPRIYISKDLPRKWRFSAHEVATSDRFETRFRPLALGADRERVRSIGERSENITILPVRV